MKSFLYVARLLSSLGWKPQSGKRVVAGMLVVLAVVTSAGAYVSAPPQMGMGTAGVDALLDRAGDATTLLTRVEDVYDEEVAPIERVLLGYRDDDSQLVRRIAVSLVREAKRTNVEPRLLLAVLLVENPDLKTGASSFVGAQGLMQVMPFWRGHWKRCAPRLDDIDANICHGAHIFAMYLGEEKGNVDRALLRYNGCVNGTNTPDCKKYPQHVYARAGRASLLSWKPTARRATGPAAP